MTSVATLPHHTPRRALPPSSAMVAYTDQHEEFLTAPKPGARYLVANAILHHRRFLWVVCASIALLSARHLLVEQNIHYPLQLYFNHLAVTGLLALRPYWTWKSNQKLFCARPQLSRLVTRGTVLLAASTGVTALSTICTFQAVLHVQNQPTLVMMIVRPTLLWIYITMSYANVD